MRYFARSSCLAGHKLQKATTIHSSILYEMSSCVIRDAFTIKHIPIHSKLSRMVQLVSRIVQRLQDFPGSPRLPGLPGAETALGLLGGMEALDALGVSGAPGGSGASEGPGSDDNLGTMERKFHDFRKANKFHRNFGNKFREVSQSFRKFHKVSKYTKNFVKNFAIYNPYLKFQNAQKALEISREIS